MNQNEQTTNKEPGETSDFISAPEVNGNAQDDFVQDLPNIVEPVVIEPTNEDIVVSEVPPSALEAGEVKITAPVDELYVGEDGVTLVELPEVVSNVVIPEGREAVSRITDETQKYDTTLLVEGPSLDVERASIIGAAEMQRIADESPEIKQEELFQILAAASPGQFRCRSTDKGFDDELNANKASRVREWRQNHSEVAQNAAGYIRSSQAIEPNSGINNGKEAADFFGRINNVTRKARIPCNNSGVTVIVSTPEDIALLLTEEQISHNKAEAGYMTFGLSFSNSDVYVKRAVFDLIKRYVVRHNVSEKNGPIDLGDILSIYDLNMLAAGLTSVICPDGHRFVRNALSREGDITKRRQIVETVAPLRTLLTDYKALTPDHLEHLRKSAVTPEEVLKYRNTLPNVTRASHRLSDSTSVTFRVPTINEYLAAGDEWLKGIEEAIKVSATTADLNQLQRRNLFRRMLNQTYLREYAHWVESITETKETGVFVTNREAVYETLDTLSRSMEVRKNFLEAIADFKARSAVQITAVPVASDESSPNTTFKGYVEYDPVNVFFTLLGLKRGYLGG